MNDTLSPGLIVVTFFLTADRRVIVKSICRPLYPMLFFSLFDPKIPSSFYALLSA